MNTPLREDPPWTDSDPEPGAREPGVHPMGLGLGAAVGGIAAGALVGSVAGPVGTLVGAAVGAAAGGLAGHAADEAFNPSVHDAYWRDVHREPYLKSGDTFEDYIPGYRDAYETPGRHMSHHRMFDDLEPEKRSQYEHHPLGRRYGTAL